MENNLQAFGAGSGAAEDGNTVAIRDGTSGDSGEKLMGAAGGALQVFSNEEFGEIRTALIDNELWFVAADVCNALDIENPRQAVSRLDEDEKLNTVISNDGNKRGNPNMTVVNEPGLYCISLVSYTSALFNCDR